MYALPTLYKARNLPLKRPVCAICVDRTRGRTEEIRLGYRVTVWLCPGHAAQAFQTKRGGRDFVRTLMGVWQANGCMTAARHRALDAHLTQLRPTRRATGPAATPGRSCAAASKPTTPPAPRRSTRTADHRLHTCTAHTPSRRTLQRWHAERRWLTPPAVVVHPPAAEYSPCHGRDHA